MTASASAYSFAAHSIETALRGGCPKTAGGPYQSSALAAPWRQDAASLTAEVVKRTVDPKHHAPAVAEIAHEQAPWYDARMVEPTFAEAAVAHRQVWRKDSQAWGTPQKALLPGGMQVSWTPWKPAQAEALSAESACPGPRMVVLVELDAPPTLAPWVLQAPRRWD